uniref:Serine/threonine protein phosphatase 7 long form isogeny n=1 Tax=Cajanus cajan TaxID=3821 RepID=A0A151S037_CAJCA|nr:hypothetical protein KK1_030162 [Cajanus cajan]
MTSSCTSMRVSCGPVEEDLLSLQSIHVSQHVWNREEDRRLLARRAAPTRNGIDGIPHVIVSLLDQAGFGWIARLSYIKVSPGLLTALVERKTYAWGAAVLGCLYRNLCTSTDYKTPSCGGFTLLL